MTPTTQPRTDSRAVETLGLSAVPAPEDLSVDVDLAPRELAIYLLHLGAEIEHALMVQYFYAAFSLGLSDLTDAQPMIAASSLGLRSTGCAFR